MKTLALLAAVLALAPSARAADPDPLRKAQGQAQEAVEAARRERAARIKHLERLKKDLRYIAEELDREVLDADEDKGLSAHSKGGLARLAALRKRGALDPALNGVLDRLEALYRSLPDKEYAKEYATELVKSFTDDLRWRAENARAETELLEGLRDDLVLPAAMPKDGEVSDLAFFPQDVPLEKFKRLGPIRVFLMKHRLKRPPSIAKTTAADIVAGTHNVQVGVEVEGLVKGGRGEFDLDWTFEIGDLHIEITPEWRLLHKGFPTPKAGDKVRVRGWTYYDIFHKAELEYDPEDPVLGAERVTLWEIHPAQEIELLP